MIIILRGGKVSYMINKYLATFKKKTCFITLLFFITITLTSCNPPNTADNQVNDKVTVAVSIIPQETFVKAVAGDLVDIAVMIPPGNSPANYAPSPQELIKLSDASLYFSIGVPTEKANILPKLPDINDNITVLDLAQAVTKIYPEREFAPGERDPHIWLSPKRVKIMIDTIATSLIEVDPQHQDIYEANATAYKEKLDELDKKIKLALNNLPQRSFLVYHPSFGYFADDYGLKMIAIENAGKEATITEIQKFIDFAKKEKIKVIFYQAEIDNRQSRTIAEEIGGKTEMIAPLSPDYIKNLEKTATVFSQVLNQK